jgi:hypothetical protein
MVTCRPRVLFSLAAAASAAALVGAAPAADLAQPPLPQALAKTAQAKSFRFSFTLGLSGAQGVAPGGKPLTLSGSGATDTGAGASQLSVNLGPLAALLGGASGGSAPVPTKLDIVVLKQALYLRLPSLAQQVAPGKEWLKLEASKLPPSAGGANLGRLSQVSPTQALRALQAAVKARKLGSATVRGVRTTRYRVSIDLRRVVAALPKADQASARAALKEAGVSILPADVWVDGSGLLRRLSTSLSFKAQGSKVGLRLSVDLYDYNKPLRIAAPPPEQVADGSQLLAQLLGGLMGSGKTGP